MILITRTISLPDELYTKLQAIAKENNITVSAVIKIACSEYVKNQGK